MRLSSASSFEGLAPASAQLCAIQWTTASGSFPPTRSHAKKRTGCNLSGLAALNIAGAGSSGLQLLLPGRRQAMEESWGAPVSPPLAASMIGAMWTAAAAVSVAGLFAPVTWRWV